MLAQPARALGGHREVVGNQHDRDAALDTGIGREAPDSLPGVGAVCARRLVGEHDLERRSGTATVEFSLTIRDAFFAPSRSPWPIFTQI